jgi:ABC-type transport system involved in multi-copper enzyme maturation permease subunit
MTMFAAMLLDAYRELNAKKLFWITLTISALVVISFGSIGFDEKGMSVMFGLKQIESEYINSETPWARALYMGIFSDFIVTIWLSWVAVILALISTCSVFPDFLAGGSIDLVLSKPIHRVTLFATKYVVSLLFVLLQVGLFCVGIFFCVGLRIGEWNWMIFAAIPVVTVFYSYLFCVCVLTGVITRSAITALLLTMLFWVSLFTIQTTEGLLNQYKIRFEVQMENEQRTIDRFDASLAALDQRGDEASAVARADLVRRRADAQAAYDAAQEGWSTLDVWHSPADAAMTLLPKNAQTIALLPRWLKDPRGFSISAMMRGEMTGSETGVLDTRTDVEWTRRLEEEQEAVSPFYIIGTSVAFEAVILAIACVIFVRRDF